VSDHSEISKMKTIFKRLVGLTLNLIYPYYSMQITPGYLATVVVASDWLKILDPCTMQGFQALALSWGHFSSFLSLAC
jgi:hypothetical protein